MSARGLIPSGPEIAREALILLGGAILAALILSRVPALRSWITENTRGDCSCND